MSPAALYTEIALSGPPPRRGAWRPTITRFASTAFAARLIVENVRGMAGLVRARAAVVGLAQARQMWTRCRRRR